MNLFTGTEVEALQAQGPHPDRASAPPGRAGRLPPGTEVDGLGEAGAR